VKNATKLIILSQYDPNLKKKVDKDTTIKKTIDKFP
jgi:hypothetical protein